MEVDWQDVAGHERVVGGNIAAMTEGDEKAEEKLWMELAKDNADLGAECTADEAEQAAAWCPVAIGNVLDTSAKKIRICSRSMRWCKANPREGRKVVASENRRGHNSDEATKAKAELQNSIRHSEMIMLTELLRNLLGGKVWEAARYMNPWAGMTVESFTDREGKQAKSLLEKEEMMRLESFPPNDNDQYYELPPTPRAHTHGTE